MSNISSDLLGEEIGEWMAKNRKDLSPQALARMLMDSMTRFITIDHNKAPGEARMCFAQASMCLLGMGFQMGYSSVDEAQEMFRGVREEPRMLPRIELASKTEGGHLPSENDKLPAGGRAGGGLLEGSNTKS